MLEERKDKEKKTETILNVSGLYIKSILVMNLDVWFSDLIKSLSC